MRLNRAFCILLACVTAASCMCMAAGAVESVEWETTTIMERASNRFNMDVAGNTAVKASSSFPLAAGETVRINASYTPNANVDFGLIDSDGTFHYVTATGGSIDKTIKVDEKGNYTLAVRNNSSDAISVSGYVTY